MRLCLYKDIHKFVRKHLFTFSEVCGQVDFTSDAAVEGYQQQMQGFLGFLASHAEREEMGVHPLLASKGLEVGRVAHDHTEMEEEAEKLRGQVAAILAAEDASEKERLGHEHYLDLCLYVSTQLQHLNEEERVVMPLIHEHYSDEELREVVRAIYTHLPEEEFFQALPAMVGAGNAQELEELVQNTKDFRPEFFDRLIEAIRPIVGDEAADAVAAKHQN